MNSFFLVHKFETGLNILELKNLTKLLRSEISALTLFSRCYYLLLMMFL